MTRDAFVQLIVSTFTNPRETGETVLALRPSREVVWTALIMVMAASGLLYGLQSMLLAPAEGPVQAVSPVLYGAIIGLSLLVSAAAFTWVGGRMGGTGRFDEAMALFTWLGFVLLLAEVAVLFLALILPPLAGVVALAMLVVGLWIQLRFIQVLHRYAGVMQAIFCTLAVILAVTVFATALILLFGGVQ